MTSDTSDINDRIFFGTDWIWILVMFEQTLVWQEGK